MTRNVATALVCALALAAVVVAFRSKPAWSHDPYSTWHPPNNPGTSCCNNSDCRPTRADVDDKGNWRAWNGVEWLTVPADRLLPPNYAGDGRSHLCEKGGFIYCFTAGEIRG